MSGFCVPEKVIQEYLKSFVFVDDKISLEHYPPEEIPDEKKSLLESEPEEIGDFVPPATPLEEKKHTKALDTALSKNVYESISKGGYPCDLFRFEVGKLEHCKRVCKNCDVVILDWELDPHGEGHIPSLKIIKSLYEEKGLRFIYLYTVVGNLENIKSEIEEYLEITCEGEDFDFHADYLYFFVRKKFDGVNPEDILDSVINAISGKYKGLMARFGLEFASDIRGLLPTVLSRYDERIDSPLVNLMASTKKDEEFYSILSRIFLSDIEYAVSSKITASPNINRQQISNFLKKQDFTKKLRDAIESGDEDKMNEIGNKVLKLLETVFRKRSGIDIKNATVEDINEDPEAFLKYLGKLSENVSLPKKIKGLKEETILNKQETRSQLISILSCLLISDTEEEIEPLAYNMLDAHCRFQCLLSNVREEAISLTQGTILKDGETYYLCITPLCDISFPNKIKHRYVFILGKRIPKKEVAFINRDRNSISVIYEDSSPVIIRWNLFDIISLKISDTSLCKPVKAEIVAKLEEHTGEEERKLEKELNYVGQLRLDCTLSILNMGLSRTGRVGIDTDELIRLRSYE
ncbi:MAG: hypothetical protein A7316_08650 [Candidatus Altiarchaeales archaeon WOR_SM1_86-2]|nr:MAG: hypothetical protein A7316_08650 [Candidatus Altiarchaeales archaeon WOR_SM1_86-2]